MLTSDMHLTYLVTPVDLSVWDYSGPNWKILYQMLQALKVLQATCVLSFTGCQCCTSILSQYSLIHGHQMFSEMLIRISNISFVEFVKNSAARTERHDCAQAGSCFGKLGQKTLRGLAVLCDVPAGAEHLATAILEFQHLLL